jgi:PTH1 family peptidyl-tRNA hydrolase
MGVGHPGVPELVHPHVLSDFAKNELPWVDAMCVAIADEAELLAAGRPEEFQNRIHLALRAKGFDAAPGTLAD